MRASAARVLVDLDAGDARYFGETEGLARWGESWLHGDTAEADRHLVAMQTLSGALVATSGEALLHDSVAAIAHADSAQRDALARGHIACRDGRRAYDERALMRAETLLSTASRELDRARSPLASATRMFAATAAFWQGRHEEAEREFRALRAVVPARYEALHAQLDWQLSSYFLAVADTGNALHHYLRAIETFTALGERNNVAYLHNIVAQVYDDVRDHDRAAIHRTVALRELGKTSNIRLAHALNAWSTMPCSARHGAPRAPLPQGTLTPDDPTFGWIALQTPDVVCSSVVNEPRPMSQKESGTKKKPRPKKKAKS